MAHIDTAGGNVVGNSGGAAISCLSERGALFKDSISDIVVYPLCKFIGACAKMACRRYCAAVVGSLVGSLVV